MENVIVGGSGGRGMVRRGTTSSCRAESSGNSSQSEAAFALPDLLAIIAVLALLALVLLPAHASLGRKAGILECKNNLRQAGWAIDMYSRDYQDYLPGPIWTGVYYSYRTGDSGSLAHYLAPYFGLAAPTNYSQDVEVLKCPASVQAQPGTPPIPPLKVPICFLACSQITNSPGPVPGDIISYPFGRPSAPYLQPVRIIRIRRPSEEWTMMDVDRQKLISIGSSGATYMDFIPVLPVHNNRPGGPAASVLRNALYFDGTVRGITSRY